MLNYGEGGAACGFPIIYSDGANWIYMILEFYLQKLFEVHETSCSCYLASLDNQKLKYSEKSIFFDTSASILVIFQSGLLAAYSRIRSLFLNHAGVSPLVSSNSLSRITSVVGKITMTATLLSLTYTTDDITAMVFLLFCWSLFGCWPEDRYSLSRDGWGRGEDIIFIRSSWWYQGARDLQSLSKFWWLWVLPTEILWTWISGIS